ncbi:MAG: pseudouridine synthase [Alphaproteobacteria bacterium]
MSDIKEVDTNNDMRLAKRIARSGVCSRRDAEVLITEGKVKVNGKVVDNPATNVSIKDKIIVEDNPLPDMEALRLWLYHKPVGYITTSRDELGRKTIYDNMPDGMPRVITVGRLDLNSEGLLLLTNDGDFARSLELPNNGWKRTYKVRVHGRISKNKLASLEKGITIDGIKYGSIAAEIIGEQTASNVWVQITLNEGKNREIRRVMEHLGYKVSRLMRVSYGPFNLSTLKKGEVREVTSGQIRQKVMGEKPKKSWAKAKPKKNRPNSKKPYTQKPKAKKSSAKKSTPVKSRVKK